jgi:energy-coupling factor transporter ATP-binding protein EcfA2
MGSLIESSSDDSVHATASPPIDGLDEILAWSAAGPAWQKDALRRLCAGPDLDAADEVELLEILKGSRVPAPLSDQHIRQRAKASRTIALKSIKDAESVNALAPKQILSFAEKGMTIVYGENGSGKSGYVRILKAACRARLDRSFNILPDIYGGAKGAVPTAAVTFLDGTATLSPQWTRGTPGHPALSAISVFDSAAGNIHVTGTNDIAYTPFPLLVLARLAKATDSLRASLTAEITQLEGQISATVVNHECSKHSATGKLLEALSGKTKPADVEVLCLLSDAEKAELIGLKKDLADDPAVISSRSTKLAQRLDTLGQMIAAIARALDDSAVRRIITLRHEIAATTEAAQGEAQRRFASDPLPVGNPAWEALWSAAKAYAEEHIHPDEAFPQTGEGSVCVLCQRPHDEHSADRFRRFQAFVADELGRQIKSAQTALAVAFAFSGADYLKTKKIAEFRDYLVGIGESDLADSISGFLVRAAWRHKWMRRATGDALADLAPGMTPPPRAAITAVIDALRSKAHAMQSAIESPERQALRNRHDELADREWLFVVKDDVQKAIGLKARIATLKVLLPQTARARITSKSTSLAKELVTDRLRDRFADEVSQLGISRLRVELRQASSEAGQPRFKVCFIVKPDENVGAVLSEGELRCLAIATFLAELETAEGTSGIVLDDPISSLDHAHREKIAARLAKEALCRQVIVFTHDIPFLSQLHRACKEAETPLLMRLISRGAMPGFCHDEAPPTHRSITDAIAAAATNINNKRHIYNTGSPDWNECVTGFGGTLRKLWERAVEEVMAPVLTRWTHKIDTGGFIALTVLTPTDHATMRHAYGQCSVWEHYQPAAQNAPQPSVDDLVREAERLATWFDDIKSRQKAVS